IVRSFVDGEMFYQISTLTTNSLISGYVKSNNKKVEDMASQINDKVLIIKDFTSILSMSKDKRDEILGQLREAYDGYISKKLGNLDKKISIETSFGLIACVTPVIDKHYKPMGQLGERFLKLRLDYDDDHILDGSEKNEGKEEEMRNKISDAIMGFLTNIEVYDVTFSDSDKKKIKLLVKWVAKIRTPVSGRWQGDDFVLDVAPQSEKPTRLYKQFKKLATLLCIIEGKTKFDEQTFRMLERIAMDTAPPDRLKVWQHIVNHNNTPDHEIVKRLRIPRTTLNRIVDSLYRLDLIDKNRDGNEENAPYFCSISENAIKSFGALESGQIMGQLSVPETSQSQRKL
ncbi:MarR family transcriptional regulator, partial [bacterium]|nr:MarR family transcriptional regulator [bacterium]